ncbi:deoxyribodipyrimidine photo-lyase [Ectopseudomonas mendocina]|uniref:Deoxyribodipyrimidine photo-lyase n=1 Tax=Ectopseudomonas mendocina TaxID=300 RepID=A0ABZ2REH7_ECTME
MRQLMWFRSDLRTQDNTALNAAMQNGPTLAVFFITPGQWLEHDDAPSKVDFWLRNLHSLQAQLKSLNVPLLIRHVAFWRDVPEEMAKLCQEHTICAVHSNEEYGLNEAHRDQQVANRLSKLGVQFNGYLDQLLFQPGSILNRSGNYFQVYSQFRKVCYQRLHTAMPSTHPLPKAQANLGIESDKVPTEVAGFDKPTDALQKLWPAGEIKAHLRLQRFADEYMEDYDLQRDLPAIPGTSQLSPYLAAGVLSPRQCLEAALMSNRGEFESGTPGVVTWINELLWREFYKHILVGFPQVSRHQPFRAQTKTIPWRHAPQELQAWKEGRTGFPLVDAAIRQLLATGWMHNRLRMVVAMFLSKNLLIDWREGERFFMAHLIDGDLAANNGGWQWSASTGTDAVPWFRLFNPINQSRRFDPQGRFIRHWLPELADLDEKFIHEPWKAGSLFARPDYPQPMIDLNHSRDRVLHTFRSLSVLEGHDV